MPQPSPHSAAQGLAAPAGVVTPAPTSEPHLHPHLLVEPLPHQFWDLPWRERRHLEKMRANQAKMVRDWEKAQRQWEKAQVVDAEKRRKNELQAKKADLR